MLPREGSYCSRCNKEQMESVKLMMRLRKLGLLTAAFILATLSMRGIGPETPDNRPYADMKRWHLGFSVGMHFQDMQFTHSGIPGADGSEWYAEVPSWSPGFCVNVMADLRLHSNVNLRFSPGMYFGSKTIEFLDHASLSAERQTVKSAYVVLPVEVKLSGARLRNARPYVTAGVMGAFDIGKKTLDILDFRKADAYLTVGLGCDFYLPFFKLIPEVKFCFGLTDILRHDRPDLADAPELIAPTQALKKVKSNMVVINFYFE